MLFGGVKEVIVYPEIFHSTAILPSLKEKKCAAWKKPNFFSSLKRVNKSCFLIKEKRAEILLTVIFSSFNQPETGVRT